MCILLDLSAKFHDMVNGSVGASYICPASAVLFWQACLAFISRMMCSENNTSLLVQ